MKKLFLIPLLALAAIAPARAETTDLKFEGTIKVGNAATKQFGGVTELGSPCMGSVNARVPAGTFQDVDGHWIQLPEGLEGLRAELKGTTTDAVAATLGDVDAWFYDDSCSLIGPTDENPEAYWMATSTAHERGFIPPAAAWVCVDLVTGANVPFTFTVYGAPA